MKIVEEINKKVFTNDENGLFMEKIKEGNLKEVLEELNFVEKIFFKKKFIKIYKLGITFGFNNK